MFDFDKMNDYDLLDTYIYKRDDYRREYGDYIPNIESDLKILRDEILRRMLCSHY